MRFCNKQCEKEAHTKEKSTEMVLPENPGETEDLLKKEMEAEMKRDGKIRRQIIRDDSLLKTKRNKLFGNQVAK